MINKRWLISMIAIFTVIFLSTSICSAQDNEFSRLALKGVKGIYVSIENLPPVLNEGGLTKDQIQTDVELKLRMAGIKVLSKLTSPDELYLYVNINAHKSEFGLIAFNINIDISQPVILTRNTSITGIAVTWSTSYVGVVGEKKITMLRETIKDRVDKFINDYLSVNPKK